MFKFPLIYLTDEGPLNLFVPKKKDVGDNIWTFVAFYDFVLAKDWWRFNNLSLGSPLDTSLTNTTSKP